MVPKYSTEDVGGQALRDTEYLSTWYPVQNRDIDDIGEDEDGGWD